MLPLKGATIILEINKMTQDKFFELCKYYGGYCDCEIIFNAKPQLLEK
ncbi:MAG: DUF2695 domain-containing protein [Promethearchaeota archaeon]